MHRCTSLRCTSSSLHRTHKHARKQTSFAQSTTTWVSIHRHVRSRRSLKAYYYYTRSTAISTGRYDRFHALREKEIFLSRAWFIPTVSYRAAPTRATSDASLKIIIISLLVFRLPSFRRRSLRQGSGRSNVYALTSTLCCLFKWECWMQRMHSDEASVGCCTKQTRARRGVEWETPQRAREALLREGSEWFDLTPAGC